MLCKCHWIVLYTVHFTAFCLGGRFFPDTVYKWLATYMYVRGLRTVHPVQSAGIVLIRGPTPRIELRRNVTDADMLWFTAGGKGYHHDLSGRHS